MDIHELTQAMHRFVDSRGWYQPDSPRPQTLRNLAISLNLEAGEVLDISSGTMIRKTLRVLRMSWRMWLFTCCSWPACLV